MSKALVLAGALAFGVGACETGEEPSGRPRDEEAVSDAEILEACEGTEAEVMAQIRKGGPGVDVLRADEILEACELVRRIGLPVEQQCYHRAADMLKSGEVSFLSPQDYAPFFNYAVRACMSLYPRGPYNRGK